MQRSQQPQPQSQQPQPQQHEAPVTVGSEHAAHGHAHVYGHPTAHGDAGKAKHDAKVAAGAPAPHHGDAPHSNVTGCLLAGSRADPTHKAEREAVPASGAAGVHAVHDGDVAKRAGQMGS